ncbi:MAG: sucrase/ferredoxin-like family protein [Gemmatimonadota bacterium]|nr:sucrase/ferredoxin-like family protein [Gemmatimonadota bacterium]
MNSRGPWPIHDTVKSYHRHWLACVGTTSWPARIEEADGLLGRMAADVRERRDGDPPISKLTATDEPTEGTGLDLVVFPDGIRYRGVDEARWEGILRDHVEGDAISDVAPREAVEERWIVVCAHGERDERCGECGPPLIDALREAVEEAGIETVRVRATSHVGGHKYAGNVIVFPEGHWYGYVRPADASRIVREHVVEGRVIDDLHRGSMEAP